MESNLCVLVAPQLTGPSGTETPGSCMAARHEPLSRVQGSMGGYTVTIQCGHEGRPKDLAALYPYSTPARHHHSTPPTGRGMGVRCSLDGHEGGKQWLLRSVCDHTCPEELYPDPNPNPNSNPD